MRERRHELRREERDSEEDQHGAHAHGQEQLCRGEAGAEQPVGEQREAGEAEQRRAERPVASEASRRQRRALAYGGDRRHARRSAGGPQAGDDRHEHADDQRDDHRPGLQEEAAVRQREPGLLEQPEETLGEAQADHDPGGGSDEADHERLDEHGPHDLPPRGADRAQGGELARPLGDRDRERVRDHERADEERDAAEREQEALEEA